MLEWSYIKSKLYFLDGSLRDILIYDMNNEIWQKWIEYINTNFKVRFKNYFNDDELNYINYDSLKKVWNEGRKLYYYALVDLGGIFVNCYFNTSLELNQDISPSEIKSISDHNILMDYLKYVSLLLNREIILTEEMDEESILLKIKKGEISLM
jgi:hypothetical protein